MTDKEVIVLVEKCLEEIASKGAGQVESYPAFQALRAAVRPVRGQQPPPDSPKAQGFVPNAFTGDGGKETITPAQHLENLAEIKPFSKN